jgi:hypothetical protein
VLLVRFAGNQVGVNYQVEQIRGEVILDDEWIWRSIASTSLGHNARVLPSELPAFVKDIDTDGALWQIGAADGRIRMLDNKLPTTRDDSADFLARRVKQQLDPNNLFTTRTTS